MEFSPLQMALMRNATAVTPFDNSPGFGGYLAEAMAQQSQQNVQNAQVEAANYEMDKERRTQELLSRIDINDPNAIAELMKVAPEVGIKLMQQQRLVKQQQMAEEMMSGGIGAGGDIDTLDRNAAAAEMMGNEPLADYFARQADRAYDRDKEARKESTDLDKQRRGASISGFELVEGVVPTTSVVTDATSRSRALKTYGATRDRIKEILNQYGDNELFTPVQSAEIESAFADLRDLERELGNTGVLNVGELPFLEQKYAPFNPLKMGNRTVSRKDLIAKADSYFNQRENRLLGEMESFGYKPKEGAKAKANSAQEPQTGGDSNPLQQLMDMKSRGELTPEEEAELDGYLQGAI